MIHSEKKIKEPARLLRNTRAGARQPVITVRRRAASKEEAADIERALDRLLTELVRQERAREKEL